ncbi:MAG: metal ABC transporter ATP-binding protein [Nitrososphaerota archaeon]|nr:metal ABC transporter ATP-binding protein [Aigarchaeota archaeon]MDW8076544.1 metal ABC transporter ATP-binding protein [Nitrososphaerota archaeon]
MNSVEAFSLTVRLNGFEALSNVTLSLNHPTFTAIIGPNGAGKTTLLKTILGLLKPQSGSIRVMGLDPTRESKKVRLMIGYVPQRDRVSFFVPIKVKDVVMMSRLVWKRPPRWITDHDVVAVKEALRIVGIEGLSDRRFDELSSGQQQKVLIARAIVSDPKLLLLDEPFNGVDLTSQHEIMNLIKTLKESGVSIIMVTHDVSDVINLIDNLVLLYRSVIASGKPEDVLKEEVLKKVYGNRISIYSKEPCLMFVPRDSHG